MKPSKYKIEIKYDDMIPDFIRFRLELNHLEQISFSKFNNCMDSLNGGFVNDFSS